VDDARTVLKEKGIFEPTKHPAKEGSLKNEEHHTILFPYKNNK